MRFIPAPKKPQRLPVVLSPEEVLHFLSSVGSTKHRAILTTCYAAGRGLESKKHRRGKMGSGVAEGRVSLQSWWDQTREGRDLANATTLLMRCSGLLAI